VKDTAQVPGGSDWICLALAGHDGGSINPRGLYQDGIGYQRLDLVSLNGGTFVAKQDNPGACPGDGWQLVTSQGKRGVAGERGPQGERGPAGPPGKDAAKFVGWDVDSTSFTVTPLMSDGSKGPPLHLHALFQQFLNEVAR
jgi:hypothetical protein